MTMADFEASGLFSETKVDTKRVSPVEEKLLGLLHAGRHIEFFELAVQSRLNILISGATGSGKTTFSKGLIKLIPENERLLTIEDPREQLGRAHVCTPVTNAQIVCRLLP